MSRTGGTGGFTMLELMVVIAVVGVMAAIGLPGQTTSNQSTFQGYKIQLQGILLQARNLARSRQECVTVLIAPQLVTVTSFNMPTPCTAPFSGTDQVLTSAFSPSVTLTPFDVANPLVFNTIGGLDYPNPTQMTLQALNQSASYSILPTIGQIVGL